MLKTLLGPWALLAVIPLEVTNFVLRGMPWRGETLWTTDWFAITLFITGPILCGAAAVDAARLSRDGNFHLVSAVPRPYRPYLRAAAWAALPAVAVHVITVCVALVFGGFYGDFSATWTAVALLVQCAALCWYVAMGSAVGRFAGPLVAGIAAAAGSFAFSYFFSYPEDSFGLLDLGGATVSRLGYEYRPAYLLTQLVLFTVTAVVALLVVPSISSGIRVPSRAGTAALGAVLAAVVLSPQVPLTDRLSSHPVRPTQCVGKAPKICVYPEHHRVNDRTVEYVETLVRAARSAGYAALVPDRVDVMSRTYRPQNPGVQGLEVDPDGYDSGVVDIRSIADSLTTPYHCDALYDDSRPPGDRYWIRHHSLTKTLLDAADVRFDDGEYIPGSQVLTPEAAGSVVADFKSCALETP
ncbi:hypothetical protein [Streptomyces griseoruber]|uniref:hypothetical protein n=1 Tax=Streptomyces griseoruber TaxID=1943 RepID=UPI0012FEFCEC|nr:hypothetical protein [Streptomyces griseoruber]